MPVSPPVFLRVLLAGLLLGAGPAALRADIKNVPGGEGRREAPRPRPPVARATAVESVRGLPLDIRLSGLTSSTRPLQFIIRRGPRYGTLAGPPVVVGKDSAVVRYTADPASRAAVDSFFFAVKLEGSGSSVEAEVTVRLTDPAPVLEAPPGLDLGRLIAGEAVERVFTVRNKGNAAFLDTVPLPENCSWEVPAGGKFNVPPGGSFDATLKIKTRAAGELNEVITLRPGQILRVTGRSLPPFLAFPSKLRLQWEPGTDRRGWQFNLSNNRSEALTIRLSAPPGMKVPEALHVAAGESSVVKVTAEGDVSKVLSGQVRLSTETWTQEVSVEAAAAPPAVKVTSGDGAATVLDFGNLTKGDEASAVRPLTLRNIGGTPALIRFDLPRFFVVEGITPDTVLAPQTERKVLVRPKPDEPGRLKEDLVFLMPGGDHTVTLLADLDPKAAQAALMSGNVLDVRPPPPAGTPRAPTTERGARMRAAILSTGLMETIPNTDRTLPMIEVVNLVEAEPERLVFTWAVPGPGKWTYRVLVRMLRNHGLQQAPIPEYGQMDNVTVTSTPEGGLAEVRSLRAEARWSCRIVAIREDGVATRPGPELTFLTPPESPSRWPWRLLALLGVVSLVLYVRQKWREDVKW